MIGAHFYLLMLSSRDDKIRTCGHTPPRRAGSATPASFLPDGVKIRRILPVYLFESLETSFIHRIKDSM